MADEDGSNHGAQRRSSLSDIEKRQEYLSLLQERNRIKKMMTVKTDVQLENEEKERGFMTHFLGANAQRQPVASIKKAKHPSQTAASSRRTTLPTGSEVESAQEPIVASIPRRGWAVKRPKFLFGMRVGSDQDDFSKDPTTSAGGQRARMIPDDGEEEDYGEDFDMEEHNGEITDIQAESCSGISNIFESSEMSQSFNTSAHLNSGSVSRTTGESDSFRNKSSAGKDSFNMESSTPSTVGSNKNLNHNIMSPSTAQAAQSTVSQSTASARGKQSNGSGSFGTSILQLKSELSPNFLQRDSGNVRNSREGLPYLNSLVPSTENTNILLEGPPSTLLPFDSEEHSLSVAERTSDFSGDICIRVRIHNTWHKSKFVTLNALRLTFQKNHQKDLSSSTDHNNDYDRNNKYWIDLRTFTVKVMSGLQQLPGSSETVRNVPSLLGNSSNLITNTGAGTDVKNTWKGPVNPGYPLDIYLTGNLPQQYLGMFLDREAMMNSLQLYVWNSRSGSSNNLELPFYATSSAKDIDVYVGTVCMWSGTIQEDNDNNDNCITVKIGKYIDNNILAVFAPGSLPAEVISFSKIQVKPVVKNENRGLLDDMKGVKIESNERYSYNKSNNNNNDNNSNNNDIYNNKNALNNIINGYNIKNNDSNSRQINNIKDSINRSLIEDKKHPLQIAVAVEKDSTPPTWLVGLRPKTVPANAVSPLNFDNSLNPQRSRPLSGRRADPNAKLAVKSEQELADTQSQLSGTGQYLKKSDLLPLNSLNDTEKDKNRIKKNIKDIENNDKKQRCVSANGGRRKTIHNEVTNKQVITTDITNVKTVKSDVISQLNPDSEKDENENENENENEIGTFPTSSGFTLDQKNSVSSRRLRRKEASESHIQKSSAGTNKHFIFYLCFLFLFLTSIFHFSFFYFLFTILFYFILFFS